MREITAQEAYDCLKDIPKEEWYTGAYIKDKNTTGPFCCCTLGHLNLRFSDDPSYGPNAVSSDIGDDFDYNVVTPFLTLREEDFISLASINDKVKINYNQEHPKDRVLALLTDIINLGTKWEQLKNQ